MERELGQGKGPGDCISLLAFPTAGLQHPGRKSLAVGNLHLQAPGIAPRAVWEGSCGTSPAAIPALPSQVIPDSDAHRAGLQEGDQVLSVNDVDFQDIEHSKAVEILKTAREITMRVRYFPYNYQRQKERTVH
ncbi:hypothetical protein EK904_013578 [Melospiza melodia maxima]|nr:hypothetical protein EK904_013578 [Melospiza melodia maxima]